MNGAQQWQRVMDQLYYKSIEQEQKMKQMEQLIEQLIGEVRELGKKESTYVEKIEYKFDQLKVETVEGTLHIGVLPGKSSELPLVDSKGQGQGFTGGPYDLQFSSRAQTAVFEAAKRRMQQMLKNNLPVFIQTLQDKYLCVLGEHYSTQMLRDIEAQLDGRILYYLNQMNLPQDEKAAEDEVVQRTTHDIEHALRQHFVSKKEQGT